MVQRLSIERILNVLVHLRGALPAMLPWLYGEGARHYRPYEHWPRLRKAFRALESDEARIPFGGPEAEVPCAS